MFATWCVRCCDLTADVVSFSATVSSTGASGKWPTALALFAKMNLAAVLANVIVCNSLVSDTRFENGGRNGDVRLGNQTAIRRR